MKAIFRNATVYENGEVKKQNMFFDGHTISIFSGEVSLSSDITVIDDTLVLPGFCDVHVHLREPGFSYKETIKTGTMACARGGYTSVLSMPNLSPTPDSVKNLKEQLDIINRDARISVIPFGTITVGEAGEVLSDMEGMADSVAGFSDDGKGVQSREMMLEAMKRAAALGKIISAHCEDNSLLRGGYIHDGEYARAHGHRGISSESEYAPIIRDIPLVKESGVAYHVCHVSAKESVEAIRRAKAEGVNITCETGPHYLTMNDSMLLEEGRFKMNPPIRGEEDRLALIEGILDGTVDMIATDHAPHSYEEKSRGLEKSLMGVVGIETAFPILYTELVKKNIISLEALVKLMSDKPRERFGITSDAGYTVFYTGKKYKIDPEEFLSLGKATPFEGWEVDARCIRTLYEGECVYSDFDFIK